MRTLTRGRTLTSIQHPSGSHTFAKGLRRLFIWSQRATLHHCIKEFLARAPKSWVAIEPFSGPGSGNILPRAWESTGHPYPAQTHLGNVVPGIRTSETWDSGPSTFRMCHTDFFLCRKGFPGTIRALLGSWQSPLWRMQGPPRKTFYGNPSFVFPRRKILYTMVQRTTWTPY